MSAASIVRTAAQTAAQGVRTTTIASTTTAVAPAARLAGSTIAHQSSTVSTIAHQGAAVSSRSFATTSLLNKGVHETLKDVARAADQTASDAAIKGLEVI